MQEFDPKSMESLAHRKMPTGVFDILLTERVCWDDFESYSKAFARFIGAEVVELSISPLDQWLQIRWNETNLNVWFQDYPQEVTVEHVSEEPWTDHSAQTVRSLYQFLVTKAGDH